MACYCGSCWDHQDRGANEAPTLKSEDVRGTRKHRVRLIVTVDAVDASDAVDRAIFAAAIRPGATVEYVEAGLPDDEAEEDW